MNLTMMTRVYIMDSKMVCPGEMIGMGIEGGENTVSIDNKIYSTIVGHVGDRLDVKPVNIRRSLIPLTGQTVIGRVAKVTPRFAGVDIIAIQQLSTGSHIHTIPLPYTYKATVRQQDIYSVDEREEAIVYECFRPTDLVRAKVIGTGDSSTGMLLSTGASVDCGVVVAKSVAGSELHPVAWNEMVCSVTGRREKRKVAKPVEGI